MTINGKIINLDEDQIQIELLNTDKEYIYIDFAYIGIPEELNIQMRFHNVRISLNHFLFCLNKHWLLQYVVSRLNRLSLPHEF